MKRYIMVRLMINTWNTKIKLIKIHQSNWNKIELKVMKIIN